MSKERSSKLMSHDCRMVLRQRKPIKRSQQDCPASRHYEDQLHFSLFTCFPPLYPNRNTRKVGVGKQIHLFGVDLSIRLSFRSPGQASICKIVCIRKTHMSLYYRRGKFPFFQKLQRSYMIPRLSSLYLLSQPPLIVLPSSRTFCPDSSLPTPLSCSHSRNKM